MCNDSAIEAGVRVLATRYRPIFGEAHRTMREIVEAVLAAAHPEPTKDELKKCREGGQDCLRCQAMLDAGLNPHTGQPLESAPSGDRPNGKEAGLPRSDQSGRRGASQPVDEVHAMCSLDRELVDRLNSRLIAAEQRAEERVADWKKALGERDTYRADRDREKRYNVKCEAENADLRHALGHYKLVGGEPEDAHNPTPPTRREAWEWRKRAIEAVADRDRLEMRLESTERQLAVVDKELPAWENAERDSKHCVGRVDTIRNLVADRADRDRLQRENEQLKTLMRYGSEKCRDALRGLYNALDRYGWCTGRSMESRDTLLAKARAALKEERPA